MLVGERVLAVAEAGEGDGVRRGRSGVRGSSDKLVQSAWPWTDRVGPDSVLTQFLACHLVSMPPIERIDHLASRLRQARAAYYNSGAAVMEDAAFDALEDELRALAPDHPALSEVGAAPTGGASLDKVRHTVPMGSLNKAMSLDELSAWVGGLPLGGATRFHATHKMDGGSLRLEYRNGALVAAVTRGDGLVGEDVTANAKRFRSLPKEPVLLGGVLFSGDVRVEVMLSNECWSLADPDRSSNPRNLGNGICRRKDGEGADLLEVYAFQAHSDGVVPIANTESGITQTLRGMGFATPPECAGNLADIQRFFAETNSARSSLPVWIDGVVVKIDDVSAQTALGEVSQRPKGQIAVKFPARAVRTVLREVILSVGHTGAIIPTGRFDPVEIDGTTVDAALLCNWDVIATLDIAVGDTVLLYKAGDIIPRVLEVVDRPSSRIPIAEPTRCPMCGGPVGRKGTLQGESGAVLYCLSEECPAQAMGKVRRFLTSLNILGIGDEWLVSLTNPAGEGMQPLVRDAADLFALKERRAELASLPASGSGVRLGEKRAEKFLAEIDAKRSLTLAELLGSLGIAGLGKRRVALLQQAAAGELDALAHWFDGRIADDAFAARVGVPNLGPRLHADLLQRKGLVERILAAGVSLAQSAPKPAPSASALSFCITGTLSRPRDELVAQITAAGHLFKDSVGKGLHYLVLADPSSTSSKAEKARKLGVRCIGEAELAAILTGPQ